MPARNMPVVILGNMMKGWDLQRIPACNKFLGGVRTKQSLCGPLKDHKQPGAVVCM